MTIESGLGVIGETGKKVPEGGDDEAGRSRVLQTGFRATKLTIESGFGVVGGSGCLVIGQTRFRVMGETGCGVIVK